VHRTRRRNARFVGDPLGLPGLLRSQPDRIDDRWVCPLRTVRTRLDSSRATPKPPTPRRPAVLTPCVSSPLLPAAVSLGPVAEGHLKLPRDDPQQSWAVMARSARTHQGKNWSTNLEGAARLVVEKGQAASSARGEVALDDHCHGRGGRGDLPTVWPPRHPQPTPRRSN